MSVKPLIKVFKNMYLFGFTLKEDAELREFSQRAYTYHAAMITSKIFPC